MHCKGIYFGISLSYVVLMCFLGPPHYHSAFSPSVGLEQELSDRMVLERLARTLINLAT